MKPDLIKAIVFWTIFFLPASAISGESYKFQRLFTVLQQPWYFNMPRGIATDRNGFVYVADTENHRIQKFSISGQFVSKWGNKGIHNGQFNSPYSVAVDDKGFVYVADTLNSRIQKFDSDGKFVAAWSNNTDIFKPSGIAIDNNGFVYVVNGVNHLIYKFDSNGSFIIRWGDEGKELNVLCGIAIDSIGDVYITDAENHRVRKFRQMNTLWTLIKEWGNKGKGNGEFDSPSGIAIDKEYVYVADGNNDRIQKFTTDGEFKEVWGGLGTEDGKFNLSSGIAADGKGFVYTTDWNNRRVQKFTSDGKFVAAWKSQGSGEGEFYFPKGIATDKNNNFNYVADKNNYRIQKFKSDGTFVMQWGSKGSGNGQFNLPYGIFVDSNNFAYVADTMNNRIQKFDENGVFQLSLTGGKDSPLKEPSAIAGDSNGNIYVVDWENHRVQKFDSEGNFIKTWGELGRDKSQFERPFGIAIDSDDNVYVTDTKYNCRIQKFDAEGSFISQWGKCGSKEGEFSGFCGITIDKDNIIYVADQENNRIQKFDQKGNFITAFGEFGSNPGQFNHPQYLWVSSDGIVYVSDSENNRIQAFRKTDPDEKISKAIIVAGGGPFPGNHLWDSTRMAANFAYRSLSYQGFDKTDIAYFSHDTGLDMDNNGKADDIDDIPTAENLLNAIQSAEDADTLVVYLTDHGKEKIFHLSESETLSADHLNLWLSRYQKSDPNKRVIVIYDACMSGSFVPVLSPAENRIVITSTAADEDAYFISQGSLSFSDAFWSDIFNGNHVGKSFDSAKQAVAEFQNPMIGIGSGISGEVFIGNGTSYNREAPVIENLSCVSAGNRITCTATADGKDGIARVWAVIMPSDYNIGILSRPVVELPSFELMPDSNDEKKYIGTYDNYHIRNIRIAVYAEDRNGNTSVPSLTYPSGLNVSEDKAVIAAGSPDIFGKNVTQAEDALKFQRYAAENIMKAATVEDLHLKLADCASSDTHDVLVYLVGKGSPGSFRIGNTESLSATTLNLWLNNLQEKITGKVIVIYDADYSGSFIPLLKPPQGKERILISGTSDKSQAAVVPDIGSVFSYFFWNGIHSGVNVRDSFRYAADIVGFLSEPGSSQLDDNGNGRGNEISDGQAAFNTVIGLGIRIGGAFPGDVRGTITDNSGRAIEGAKIYTDAKYIVSSLPNGKFLMANHPAGTFRVTIEAEGYQTATAEVSVTEWGITVRDIRLNPMPPPTPDITPLPAAPVPDVSVSGTTATVSWDAVSGATGYRLLYRYPPDTGYISIDIGNQTGLSAELPEGTVLYLKIQAYNDTAVSDLSDIGYISIPLSRLDVGHAGDDLKLDISCALYDGNQYRFTLAYSPQPSDTLIWKADIGSFGKITESPTPCLAVGDDLKLRLTAEYGGSRYSFTLNYADPLTWKMDTDTFKKQ